MRRSAIRCHPDKRREIARVGEASVAPVNRAFSRGPSLASKAGKKGGKSVDPAARSFSRDHDLAARAGRKGAGVAHRGGCQRGR
ncbi:MAG: general stress protein [Methylocystis sp.]|uniref:general stress protein n=1 Tax=Methylocystis sp. TaxID=1911079 RepID=UPI003DA4C84E